MDENILTKEQLLIKSEGVKDCVKWLEEQLKQEKKRLERDEKNEKDFFMFDDCGQFYRDQVIERKARMQCMVDIKIGLEKYMKKLRHMSNEIE